MDGFCDGSEHRKMLGLSWRMCTTGQSNLVQDSSKDMLFSEGQQDTCHWLVQETVLNDFHPCLCSQSQGEAGSGDQGPQDFVGAALGGYPKTSKQLPHELGRGSALLRSNEAPPDAELPDRQRPQSSLPQSSVSWCVWLLFFLLTVGK